MKIIITGASKGLGLEIAKLVIKKDWKVFALSREKNENILDLIKNHPNNFTWLKTDLMDTLNLKNNIYKNLLKFESIDGFVNNAAVAYDDLITNMNYDQLHNMYNVNVFSPMMLTKLIIRNMILHKKPGSIVHISSISAHTGYKGLSMYASTKGALEAFSKNCSREWGSLGIRSNCIVAGFMDTSMSSTLTDEQRTRIFNRTSKKEAVSIESVAKSTRFLLSNDSKSITGQNIFVDNGTI